MKAPPERIRGCGSHAAAPLLLLLLLLPVARGGELGGAVGVSTDDRFRGLSQSDGQASVQAEAHYSAPQWNGGASVETVLGGANTRLGPEFIAYAAYQRMLAGYVGGSLALRHYDYPTFRRRYDELAASVQWGTRLRATVTASPDTAPYPNARGAAADGGYSSGYSAGYGTGRERPSMPEGSGADRWAFSYELAGRAVLPLGLYLDAGAGYYDVHRQAGAGYGYGSIGVGYQYRSWDLDLRYVDTQRHARSLFGTAAEPRWLATVLWSW